MLKTESVAARPILRATTRRRLVVTVATLAASVVVSSCATNGTTTAPDPADASTAESAVPTGGSAPTTSTTDPAPVSTMEPGDINETVPTGAPTPTVAVGLDETATVAGSVDVAITSIEAVETESAVPGEISGPGLAITVEFANGSDDPVDLSGVVVDLVDADGVSATPIITGSEPFSGSVAAGASRTGTYVFTIAEAQRRDVTIHLSSSANGSIILFTGDVA